MAAKRNSIHFILTGGTMDSFYDGTIDTVKPYRKSIIPDYIKSLKLHVKTKFTQICMKDSRDITLNDMKKIKKTIQGSNYKHFIIVHGTYCMPDTARYLQANMNIGKRVILFTGSMVPLASFTNSDASFNLGFSLAEINHLKPGIYICMNGRIFDPGEIAKLIGQGMFTSIFTSEKK